MQATREPEANVERRTSNVERPTPEAPETIEAQMQWLRDGKRKAVLITPDQNLPKVPIGLRVHISGRGAFIYDPIKCGLMEIRQAIKENRIGELLGYGTAAKPEPGTEVGAVVIRDANGHEKQAVVTDAISLDAVRTAALNIADPDDDVRLESSAAIVQERQLSEFEVRSSKFNVGRSPPSPPPPPTRVAVTLRPLRDPEDLRRLQVAAAADREHEVLCPTFIAEKNGEIIGYVGFRSLPVAHAWFDRDKCQARDTKEIFDAIEMHARLVGLRALFAVLSTDGPFAGVMDRFGYTHMSKLQLHLKTL